MSTSGYYVAVCFQADRAGLLIIQAVRAERVDIVCLEVYSGFWRALIGPFLLTPLL